MTTTPSRVTCRLCDSTLTTHDAPGGTSYTDSSGSRVCPDASDPLFMAHQPWPSQLNEPRAV